jgi:hypothetical protein
MAGPVHREQEQRPAGALRVHPAEREGPPAGMR